MTRLRPPLVAFVLALSFVACGGRGGDEAPAPADTAAVADEPADEPADGLDASAITDTIARVLRAGGPMPAAEEASGIPPYPTATTLLRGRHDPVYHTIEAFTEDAWTEVEAFYDARLEGWRKLKSEDTILYERGEDAAITIVPWDGSQVPASAPEFLRRANAAIGVAWRR